MKKRHVVTDCRRQRLTTDLGSLLIKEENVLFAFLHGSFLDPNLSFSDIDVAVYLEHCKGDSPEAALALMEILERGIGYKHEVDVQILNDAPLGFRFHASRGRILVCKDRGALDQFREETWVRYWDYEPFLRQSLIYLLEP